VTTPTYMDVTEEQIEDLLKTFVRKYGLRLHTIGGLIPVDGAIVLDGWRARYVRGGDVVPLKAKLTLTSTGEVHIAATMMCRCCLKKN